MTQPIKNVLAKHQDMRDITAKVQYLESLHSLFVSVAPSNLAQSVRILGLQHGQLMIAAANATIAAKLRQLAPELTIQLKSKGCEVSGIRIKVQVSYASPAPPHTPRKLSDAARASLRRFSSSLDDSALKNALDRMSERQN